MLYDKRWEKIETVDAVGRILLEAAEIVDMCGWGRHRWDRCVGGAVWRATGAIWDEHPQRVDMYRSAMERLRSHLGMPAILWNDFVCPDRAAASAALRAAAGRR